MKNTGYHILSLFIMLTVLSGCATYNAQKVGPTPIMQAKTEIPEDQLLDVGVLVFETEEVTDEIAEDQGTHPEIRKAECHYIPYHLTNTLQQSSHWGAVRVVPAETDNVDLTVKGKVLESNGEDLVLSITVVDAAGDVWFEKTYSAEATPSFYAGNKPGEKDAYQDMYNAIANDMAEFKQKLKPEQISKIRTISKLKFASSFAPDAFGSYLKKDKNDKLSLNRLPSQDDPMMERILKVREREYMYVDTLNEYYEGFYATMWPSYENWRKLNLEERKAIQKIKRDAMIRQIAGALMMAGAIAMDVGNVTNSGAITAGMIILGGQVFIKGFNISREAEIHSAAIQELSESFGSEMEPVTIEFEGKQYKLTGSAEEQFKRWRELLRKIYFAETGFGPDVDQVENDADTE